MVPIIIADEHSHIIYINEALCKLIDCDRADMLGQSLYDFIDPTEDNLRLRLSSAKLNAKPLYHSAQFRTPSGGAVELTFKVYAVKTEPDNRVLYHISVAVFSRDVEHPASTMTEDQLKSSYVHTSLSYSDGSRLYAQVEHEMMSKRLYLSSEIDLESLSRWLGTNQLYLSQTINFFAGVSFREYINHWRIRYLRELAPNSAQLPVGELWRVAGFGSYSAFRRYLQLEFKITPSAFAKQLEES